MGRESESSGSGSDSDIEFFQEPDAEETEEEQGEGPVPTPARAFSDSELERLEQGPGSEPIVALEKRASEPIAERSKQEQSEGFSPVLEARPSVPVSELVGESKSDASTDFEMEVEVFLNDKTLRVFAISGAKGGVGKTVLASNLSLYLANIGRRVVLVDADAGGANLHTCLGTGVAPPLHRMRRVAGADSSGSAKLPEGLLADTPFAGLRLMSVGIDTLVSSASRADRFMKLMPLVRTLDADYVVVDLGGGMTRELLDAYLSADLSLYVTVPEPTAVENTYRFLRASFIRFLLSRLTDHENLSDLEKRLRSYDTAPSPLDLLKTLQEENNPFAGSVRLALEAFAPRIVINQTRLRADLDLGYAMRSAARRRLGVTIDYLGHIDNDDTVWTCVRNRQPLLLESPGAKSSKKIEKIAKRLLMIDAGKSPNSGLASIPTDTHHDLLEVDRGATDEEIRRAYKRCRETYSPHSQCCYGLFEPHELEKVRTRLDEAFDVLLDPTRRRPYELSIFTPDEPVRGSLEALDEEGFEEPPSPPELSPETHFTGALIKQMRLSQQVSLREISQRTKIGITYLKAIEEDDFAKLPALVYTRGFVGEFAKCLKLDSQQVSRTYIKRFRKYLEEQEQVRKR
ncbi:MAG: helix-turn-helix domain-containing protein [Deltaproteobacteria bacterium]|nr:helix-turn-helix domain-containing protein [Deltaproteobacteria bacterium]